MKRALPAAIGLILTSLSGCSTLTEHKAHTLIEQGHDAEGLALLEDLGRRDPKNYRLGYIQERDRVTARLLQEARQAEARNRPDDALAKYQSVLALDNGNAPARRALEEQSRKQRQAETLQEARAAHERGDLDLALSDLQRILAENPRHAEARALQQAWEIDRNRDWLSDPPLKAALRKPVSLEFRSASLQAVFDVMAQSSGLNFIFDRDVKTDLKTTIYARDTSIEDALGLILRTNQLDRKVLNDSTLLIFPNTPDKQKQYADLVIRSFYLGAADPKKVQDMLRAMVNPKAMYVDDKIRMLVVRDTMDVIQAVEKLIRNYDLVEPEVSLDVEVLEVSSDKLLNLGLQFPSQISAGVSGAAGKAGTLTLSELQNLSRENVGMTLPDPLATLNFKQTSGDANILANPQIRVRNREKAKILIGDKVPVVTTTTNQTSNAISASVSYLDVGLKLEVEPEVHVNNDVSINVGLEVSNIVKEVTSSTGLLTYQIGTRNANTVLRLHDGETQMLAGLLKDEERNSAAHFPGLGKLPLIGHLFSNESNTRSKSEIVLLITPHIVRALDTPAANGVEFLSGTGNDVSTRPLRLPDSGHVSLTNPAVLQGGAKPLAAASTGASPDAPVIASGDPENNPPAADPAVNANLSLDLVAPAQTAPNQPFTIAVILNGEAFDSLDFDLGFDATGLELVKATPMAPSQGFDYSPGDRETHVHLGATPPHSGPVALLTFKAAAGASGVIRMALQQVQARRNDAASPLSTRVASPRSLRITP